MVAQEKAPITPADSTAVFRPGQIKHFWGMIRLTAIDMNCSSVTFLSRHRDNVMSKRGRLLGRAAYEAILMIGSSVLNL